jgi:cephalosporin hydroxylase
LIKIDLKRGLVILDGEDGDATHTLGSAEGFNAVSRAWLRSGWDAKYVYSFTWMGRPVIQLPDDMIRLQEVIYAIKPDVIIETGIAHGGSLIFYASLCKAMDRGRVVGIDIEIRPHNRKAIDEHPLRSYLTLIEGSSVGSSVVEQVRGTLGPSDTVLVLLDSNHTKAHVLAELYAYAPMVTPGSYIVATDGIMSWLGSAPRTEADWSWNNPLDAAREFVAQTDDFVIEEPQFPFNEGSVRDRVTYWPGAFVKRIR